MQDIKFITDTHKFKYRVNGVIIHNNKLLTIKMSNGKSYCLPGGHIELGEDTKTAVIREMLEETKTQVTIDNNSCVSLLTSSTSLFANIKVKAKCVCR